MAFCIGKQDEHFNCAEEALYCVSHAERLGNATLKEEARELRSRLASLETLAEQAKKLAVELRIPIHGLDINRSWECYSKEHEELEKALAAYEAWKVDSAGLLGSVEGKGLQEKSS